MLILVLNLNTVKYIFEFFLIFHLKPLPLSTFKKKKEEETPFWKKLTRIGLIVGIIVGLLTIGNAFVKKTPTNQTSGDNSPIINSKDGDVDVRYRIKGATEDSTKTTAE